MTEEQFGRDRSKYIWYDIHLYCQPDPGNESVDLDVTDKVDGKIVLEEEEEEDLLEDKKLRRERSGLRIHMCLLQVTMKTICQLIMILIVTTMTVEMLNYGIKERNYSSIE